MRPVFQKCAVAVGVFVTLACGVITQAVGQQPADAQLPKGVKAVWDMEKAYRESTATRERICINGLWRWQPATGAMNVVPAGRWGYFKIPGCWPGITNYMQKDSQTAHAHPSWKGVSLRGITSAWYQREITVPRGWAGRRITLHAAYLNSHATVYVDGRAAGAIVFPGGELDLTAVCRPGGTHVLSLLVVAMPLKGVMLSYNDTNAARQVKGAVARRGLCGDVYLVSTPAGARIADVKVNTSARRWAITFDAALANLAADARYALRGSILDNGRSVGEFTSTAFRGRDLKDGRFAFTQAWKPAKLWDIHTPQNTYHLHLSLLEEGTVLDAACPVRFGFREFWIDGRDFYLNGSRIFLSSVPLDNAQIGAALATYEAVRESLERLKRIGINFVYTHNYGCQPGSHLGFRETLRAADDVGMLVGFSQPHFGHYDWQAPDADETNGYARHAAFYVKAAQNHPSVVFYSMSHNATGYSEDMNPDMIDGIGDPRAGMPAWALRGPKRALRAEAIVKRLDPGRIAYHHSSGNLGSMHTSNFYANFVPIQEMSDWFEHWATVGVKPLFTCEYSVPFPWDWAMYRGWYKGQRSFGSAQVPWEFCLAEWNAQFLGDRAFRISKMETTNLRWEAKQFRAGRLWHRWDYPHPVGSRDFAERQPVYAMYFTDNWRAFRTWGMSANSPWNHGHYWTLRDGVDKGRREFPVDWDHLQRPGFSPDYIEARYERMDLAFKRSDWIPTVAAQALMRNNLPLLAYLAGKPAAFTSKDHTFYPGDTLEKQLIVINNSREDVSCECEWSLGLPQAVAGSTKVTMATGKQERIALRFELPATLGPGTYQLRATVRFSNGETQKDAFSIHVMPRPQAPQVGGKIALFDPKGETGRLLNGMGIRYQPVDANADVSSYDILIVGKSALTVAGPAPDIASVRDGLKVVMFEQTSDVLEKRFGFRMAAYGLRWVFKRVPDHSLLAGIAEEHLRNWRGEATILPPRLTYEMRLGHGPTVKWCDIPVTRLWRCGNRGSVASVLIEKPALGDFLPILDSGYSLQYSPLMAYREGTGMVLFCQMDVTGRTESDPAAETLARNILQYVSGWKPSPNRKALYVGDPAGKRHLQSAGISPESYDGGNLSPDRVLVVGPGGGKELAGNAAAVAGFLKAGGNLLAVGLDEGDANAFLPNKVRMKEEEHIAACFEPFGVGSLLAGVGPADVHNRDPRALPLVSAGATVFGNGVLARAEDANVVFCQLAPHRVSRAQGAVPSFVVNGEDAVAGKQSALVTMGSATLGQFGQKVPAGQVGKTYTFAASVKGVGGPVRARLEVERAGRPWDRAVKGRDILVNENQWTELHVTFKVTKRFPEGWQAYIACPQTGGRFRADILRLYEGDYVPGPQKRPNLLTNPSFETGPEPWWFMRRGEQYNLRRTYRRTSFLLTRLLANMGVAGSTPLLERFHRPVDASKAEKRWLDGLYMDVPQEWDDPYRFFRW